LVEGSGRAEPIVWQRPELALEPSEQPPPQGTGASHTFFANRMPLPILPYAALPGGENQVIGAQRRPQLVILWASWCQPCLVELAAIAARAAELRQANLEILALSVDGLDSNHASTPDDARQALAQLSFPFAAGIATPELLAKLEFLSGLLYNRQIPVSVPSSFLVDSDGALAACYRGPIDFDRLQHDLQHLDDSLDDRRTQAVPLAGRWINAPRTLLLRAVAKQFLTEGFEADYAQFLAADAADLTRRRALAKDEEQRRQIDQRYAQASFDLGLALAAAGDASEAAEHFRRTLAVAPEHVEAMINLGALLARSKQLDTAIALLRRAVELDATSLSARRNLAAAFSSQGDFAAAVKEYQQLAAVQPDDADVQARLARALLETGQMMAAIPRLQRAMELDPRDRRSRICLAWLRATSIDASLRNGAEAVRIAEELRAATRNQDALVLDVLAAAYAERGDFLEARRWATRALQIQGNPQEILASIAGRIKQYEAKQAYRDVDGMYP
jgi:tetratricopeptide (TPR) repeat protein